MWFKRPLTIIDSTPDAQLYPRVGHSLVPQSSSNEALQFVLFGGASHEQGSVDKSNARCIPRLSADYPCARYEHACFLAHQGPDQRLFMFIFGGSGPEGQLLNDLWRLDLHTFEFELCQTRGQAPSPRTLHQGFACVRNRTKKCDRFYVWGGGGVGDMPVDLGSQTESGNPMWVLDMETMIWLRLPSPKHTPVPEARFGHSMAAVDETIYLFGGMNQDKKFHSPELWAYHTERNSWSILNVDGCPQPRSAHAMVALNNRWLCLYGGMSGSKMDCPLTHPEQKPVVLNDIWLLDARRPSLQWTQVQQPLDLFSAEPRLDFGVCVMQVHDRPVANALGLESDNVDKVLVSGGMDLSNVWQSYWIMDPWTDETLAVLKADSVSESVSHLTHTSSFAVNEKEKEEQAKHVK